jgi:hypothetical protein
VLRALIWIAAALLLAGCGSPNPSDETPGLHFSSASGWNSLSEVGSGCPTGGATASTGTIRDAPSDFPGETIRQLPTTDTLVWVCSTEGGGPAEFPPAALPLQLSDARVDEGWEGQPNVDVPQYLLWRRVGRYDLDVRVFFGSQHPTAGRLAEAQAELDRLRLPVP